MHDGDLDGALEVLPVWQALGWRKLFDLSEGLTRLSGREIIDFSRIGRKWDVDTELDYFQQAGRVENRLIWELPGIFTLSTDAGKLCLYHFNILLATLVHWELTESVIGEMVRERLISGSTEISLSAYPSTGDDYLKKLIGKRIARVDLLKIRNGMRDLEHFDTYCGLHITVEDGPGLCFGTFFTGFGEKLMWKTDLMPDTGLSPEMIERRFPLG